MFQVTRPPVCEFSRNQGWYNTKHKQKLRNFLEAAVLHYTDPIVFHIRVNPHFEDINALTAYLQNRMSRRQIRFGYIRATENNPQNSYLHQHWFIVCERIANDYNCFEEFLEAFRLATQNGIIRSFHLNPKKLDSRIGELWESAAVDWFLLNRDTFEECYNWCSYALKKRSKEWALENGHNPISWSIPRPEFATSGLPTNPVTKNVYLKSARIAGGSRYE